MDRKDVPKRRTRPTKVETHPKRLQIEKELGEGLQISTISKKYNISRQALLGYKRNRLPERVVKAVERRNITDAQQLFELILKSVRRMELLSDASDKFLQDPDNPGEYYMGPRAHELKVVYLEKKVIPQKKGVKIVWERRTAKLQDLINQIQGDGDKQVVTVQSLDMDPRLLLVKSSETLTKQMDTLVNAWKAIDQGRSSFVGTDSWQKVVAVILRATEHNPEIRREIADGLSEISGD